MTDQPTDGGRHTDGDRRTDRDATEETMGDVSHTPPEGDGANRVWDGTRVYDGDADEADDHVTGTTEPGRVSPRDESESRDR